MQRPTARIVYSRKQKRITRSTFSAELHSLIDAVEVGKLLCFAVSELMIPNVSPTDLIMMGNNGSLPIKIAACVDAKSVYDALIASEIKQPNEASLILVLLQLKEMMLLHVIEALFWISTEDMLADGLNKGACSRDALIKFCASGIWELRHRYLQHIETRRPEVIAEPETANQHLRASVQSMVK